MDRQSLILKKLNDAEWTVNYFVKKLEEARLELSVYEELAEKELAK